MSPNPIAAAHDARHAPAPAYASAPRRTGLLYAFAGILALAALAVMAMMMFGARMPALPTQPSFGTPESRGMDEVARKALDAAKAALDEASRDVMKPAGSPPAESPAVAGSAPGLAGGPPTESPSPASPGATKAERASVHVAKAAAAPDATRPPADATRPATRSAAAPPAVAKSTPPTSMPVAPPAASTAPAPPVQVASVDRWAQMRDEMSRCSASSIIPRMQCEQRIRARYCDGHWGSVPDCPIGRQGFGAAEATR